MPLHNFKKSSFYKRHGWSSYIVNIWRSFFLLWLVSLPDRVLVEHDYHRVVEPAIDILEGLQSKGHLFILRSSQRQSLLLSCAGLSPGVLFKLSTWGERRPTSEGRLHTFEQLFQISWWALFYLITVNTLELSILTPLVLGGATICTRPNFLWTIFLRRSQLNTSLSYFAAFLIYWQITCAPCRMFMN